MKLWRRQHAEPVDQTEAWAELLHRHRTRRGRALKLELHHREVRKQYEARKQIREVLPLTRGSNDDTDQGALARLQQRASVPAPRPFDACGPGALGLALHDEPPIFDESEKGVLRRRYGSVTAEQWRWA